MGNYRKTIPYCMARSLHYSPKLRIEVRSVSKIRHLLKGSLVKAVVLLAVSCIISGFVNCESKIPRASGPITQEIYIWQRYWNGQVQDSLATAPVRLAGLVILGAEVSFNDGVPATVLCEPDYEFLRESGTPVGLALRIGPWSGPFSENDELAVYLATLAKELVTRANDSGVEISDLQIDFDCAEASLDGYTLWVRAIKDEIDPTPLVITALPCWLKHREFRQLAEISDGYVLQVHSIERPQGPDDDFTLCDPVRSLNWIEQAAE